MTKIIDLTAETEYGHSFATRERAQYIAWKTELSPGEPVMLRVGLESFCAPGFIQGLLGAFGTERRVVVESESCQAEVRSRFARIAAAFGTQLSFS